MGEDTFEERLRACVQSLVDEGFESREDIVERTVTSLEDDDDAPDDVETPADRLARALLAAREAEEAAWTTPTDCDRLDRAFAKLEKAGIVARQHFTCCQTCGHAEIGDEIAAAGKKGVAVRGYTFFHQQDTESAVEGGGLYLAYGALEGDPAAIGREIVGALRDAGLATDWDGSVARRIHVGLTWRRRRFTKAPR